METPAELPTDILADTAVAEAGAATPAESIKEKSMELPTPKEVAEHAPEESAASPQVGVVKEVSITNEIEPQELQLNAKAAAPAPKGGFFFFSCCSPTIE